MQIPTSDIPVLLAGPQSLYRGQIKKSDGFQGVCYITFPKKIITLLYATFVLQTQNAKGKDVLN